MECGIDTGVVLIVAALCAICLGKWAACFSLAAIISITACSPLMFNEAEKQIALSQLKTLRNRILGTSS